LRNVYIGFGHLVQEAILVLNGATSRFKSGIELECIKVCVILLNFKLFFNMTPKFVYTEKKTNEFKKYV